MSTSELRRLMKIEEAIKRMMEEMGLQYADVEFDVVPPQKMLEMMSYTIPTNISNWKHGRDYERARTIYENLGPGLPYEVVINTDPARAYLMKSNPLGTQALVISHVYGHVVFFTMNRYFDKTNRDIIGYLELASQRFNEYETLFGIDEVERIVDAGHALMFHSSPFDNETEEEKRKRIFEQKKITNIKPYTEFGDFTDSPEEEDQATIDKKNQELWRKIRSTIPVAPAEDLLRCVIDNSPILEKWQKDILETIRNIGRYFFPNVNSKYINEGFATFIHDKIMLRLFRETNLLTTEDRAQYDYSNSLVKAAHRDNMNPYEVGSQIWKDIERRWDRGQYGTEWEQCKERKLKEKWNKGNKGDGWNKVLQVLRTHNDWMFMKNFFTKELVDKLKLYVYFKKETMNEIQWIRSDHDAEQIRQIIVNSFAFGFTPRIRIVQANPVVNPALILEHEWEGLNLDTKYTVETCKHLYRLWGGPVILHTQVNGKPFEFKIENETENGNKALKPQPPKSTQPQKKP